MKRNIQLVLLLVVLSQTPLSLHGQFTPGVTTGPNGELIFEGDWRALEAITDGYLTLDHDILFVWRSRYFGRYADGRDGSTHLFITTNLTAHAGAHTLNSQSQAIYRNGGLNPELEHFSFATNTVFISQFGRHTGNPNGFNELSSANLCVRAGPPGYSPPDVVDSSPGNELSFTPVSIVRADYTPVSVATSVFTDAGQQYLMIDGISIANIGGGPKRPAEPSELRRGQTMSMHARVYVSDTPTIPTDPLSVGAVNIGFGSIYAGETVSLGWALDHVSGDGVLGPGSFAYFSRPTPVCPVATSEWLIVEVDMGNGIRESNEGNNIRAYRIHKQPPLVLTNHPNVEAVAGGGAAIGIPIANVLEQQWFFNGTPLLGETNSTLSFTNVQPGQAGSYTLVASNFLGSVTSAPVVLSIATPPQITVQPPASLTNAVGSTAQFSVTATGTAPLAYQWRFNGAPLLSATNSTLSLTNVQPAQAGNYTVVVTNVAGAVTSSIAALTVLLAPPGITTPPAGQSFTPGQSLTLTAAVSGTAPFAYQWQLNGTNLPGATNTALSLTNLTVASAGAYRLVVSNAAGTATSDAARLNFVGLNLFPVLTIADAVGSTYRIEATSDLVNTNSWTMLTNLALPHSPYLFIDTSTPQAVRRYYRAIALP
jgi:hypothetical protein